MRPQPLISFSRTMAARILECGSHQTNWVKPRDHTFLVLSYASHEIICHPDIQHTRIAGHDVGTKCSRPCHVRFRPFSANAPQPVIPNGVCGVRNLSVRSIREGFLAALGMTGRSRLSHSKAWSARLPAVGRPAFRLASGTTRSPPLSLIRHDDSVIHLTTLAGHDRPANSLLCRLAMSARRHFGVAFLPVGTALRVGVHHCWTPAWHGQPCLAESAQHRSRFTDRADMGRRSLAPLQRT